MKIQEKIRMDRAGLEEYGPIIIVVFGDSVTHGALRGEIDYESVYWNRLKRKINQVRDCVPVNVINAGIGGATAKDSLGHLERQVLNHNPDFVIVSFGINDINEPLENYLSSLRTIFSRCKQCCDVVFLTPNMLNTYVAEDTQEEYLAYAKITAEYQNSGKMDLYIQSAVSLAKKMGILVCDCYSKWKELARTQDTTMLLANRINHPVREMHELFADSLFKLLFQQVQSEGESETTMYKNCCFGL